jgi:AraC-like DNA-binding protein
MAHFDPDQAARSAFVLAESYAPTKGSWHTHQRAQLVHAAEGVLTVTTTSGRWIAPPQRAIWVPGGMKHRVSSRRPFRLLTLYVKRGELAKLYDACAVVAVDRLVAELLEAAAGFGPAYPKTGPEARLVRVLLDRLPALAVAPLLHLPRPTSAELDRIARAIAEVPADPRTLEEHARVVGLGPKTAARRFLAETGLTFGRWRQQARMLSAIERLAAGSSVTRVAFEVGYEDVSSFIGAFKASMGTTPARYFST